MNRPTYTVHCKVKQHKNLVCMLQKIVNKKLGLRCYHTVDDNHILILSSSHGLSRKHLLHHPRPFFTGIYVYYNLYSYHNFLVSSLCERQ